MIPNMERATSPTQIAAVRFVQDEARWNAVQQRDGAQNGSFVYAVATTGIFCKPSCTSRRPLRENVRYFDTPAQASEQGFRACMRCKPTQDEPHAITARRMEEACRWLETHTAEAPRYAALAQRAGMGAAHFHRTFKRIVGVTPKRYADGLRMRDFKAGLKSDDSITEGIYRAGFSSSSRLYERSDASLGMSPTQYRNGAPGLHLSYTTAGTILGMMLLAATDRGICFLQFAEDADTLFRMLKSEFPQAILHRADPALRPELGLWIEGIHDYLKGAVQPAGLPLDLCATVFQMRVWDYLQSIPAGETRSYSQAAADLGAPAATRAVASACARNRVALLVPCHRVLRSNGELGGYKWGLHRKETLLKLEQGNRATKRETQARRG